MCRVFVVLFALLGALSTAAGQTTEPAPKWVGVVKSGPSLSSKESTAAESLKSYLQNLNEFEEVSVNGVFQDSHDILAMFVLAAASLSQAKAIALQHPEVTTGDLEVHLHPWTAVLPTKPLKPARVERLDHAKRIHVSRDDSDPQGLASFCRLGLENELLRAGYEVVPSVDEADAVMSIALSSLQMGRGFMGITDASDEIALNYVVQIKAAVSGELLLGFTGDSEDTPADACQDMAETTLKKIKKHGNKQQAGQE